MKVLLQILVVLATSQFSPGLAQGSTFCANRRDDLYPDPLSCTQYIHCHQSGRTSIKKCPQGTRFDRAIKVCNWARSVSCTTVPSAPLNLVVLPLNSTAIKIKWSPPNNYTKPLLHYIVTFTKLGLPGNAIQHRIDVRAKLPRVVSGLMSGTKYQIAVAAANRGGIGIAAKATFNTPLTPAPPPLDLSGSALGPTAIMLRWKDPPLPDNDSILNYHISYKGTTKGLTLHGYANTALLANLLPGKEYEIRVQAGTFGGFGAPAIIKVKTMSGGLCPPGRYSITGSKPCKLCEFGRYQGIIGQTSCIKCPAGTTTLVEGSKSLLQCLKVNIG